MSLPIMSATSTTPTIPCQQPVWDEVADIAAECRADGDQPFPISRRAIRDLVRDRLNLVVHRIQFLSAGTFHKAFILHLAPPHDTLHPLIFRIARRNMYLPRLKTQSEVATLAYLRENTNIPVPDVYAYDAHSGNELGGEWILMSKAPGIPLSRVFNTLPVESPILRALLTNLASLLIPLFKHRFDAIGSLYFADHVTPDAHDDATSPKSFPGIVPFPSISPSTSAASARTPTPAIIPGPLTSYPFFGSNRGLLSHPAEINRGPFKTFKAYLSACTQREIDAVVREGRGMSVGRRPRAAPRSDEPTSSDSSSSSGGDSSSEASSASASDTESDTVSSRASSDYYRDYRATQRSTFLVAHTARREEAVREEMRVFLEVMEGLRRDEDVKMRMGDPAAVINNDVKRSVEEEAAMEMDWTGESEFTLDLHDLSLENIFVDEHDWSKVTCIIDLESTCTRPLFQAAHLPAFLQPYIPIGEHGHGHGHHRHGRHRYGHGHSHGHSHHHHHHHHHHHGHGHHTHTHTHGHGHHGHKRHPHVPLYVPARTPVADMYREIVRGLTDTDLRGRVWEGGGGGNGEVVERGRKLRMKFVPLLPLYAEDRVMSTTTTDLSKSATLPSSQTKLIRNNSGYNGGVTLTASTYLQLSVSTSVPAPQTMQEQEQQTQAHLYARPHAHAHLVSPVSPQSPYTASSPLSPAHKSSSATKRSKKVGKTMLTTRAATSLYLHLEHTGAKRRWAHRLIEFDGWQEGLAGEVLGVFVDEAEAEAEERESVAQGDAAKSATVIITTEVVASTKKQDNLNGNREEDDPDSGSDGDNENYSDDDDDDDEKDDLDFDADDDNKPCLECPPPISASQEPNLSWSSDFDDYDCEGDVFELNGELVYPRRMIHILPPSAGGAIDVDLTTTTCPHRVRTPVRGKRKEEGRKVKASTTKSKLVTASPINATTTVAAGAVVPHASPISSTTSNNKNLLFHAHLPLNLNPNHHHHHVSSTSAAAGHGHGHGPNPKLNNPRFAAFSHMNLNPNHHHHHAPRHHSHSPIHSRDYDHNKRHHRDASADGAFELGRRLEAWVKEGVQRAGAEWHGGLDENEGDFYYGAQDNDEVEGEFYLGCGDDHR